MKYINSIRTSQPTRQVGIDYGNPLTRGLIDACLPMAGHTVNGTPVTISGTSQSLVSNSLGTAVQSASGGTGYWRYGNPRLSPPSNTPFTLISVYRLTATGTAGRVISNIISAVAGYGLLPNATNFRAAIARSGANMLFVGNPVSTAIQCDAVVYTGTQGKYYQKGVQVDTTQTGSYDVQVGTFQIGADAFGSAAAPSQVSMWGLWNRALSDAEIKSISDKPWQIFAQMARVIRVPDTGSVVASNAPRYFHRTQSGQA